MMRSVSMSWPRTGRPRPSTCLMADGRWSLVIGRWSLVVGRWSRGDRIQHRADINHFAGDRCGRDHRGAHQQRASSRTALASLEVAVRRGGAGLLTFEAIGIHPEAHRATGAAPLESRVEEHMMQTARLGRAADALRPRHDERLDVRRDAMALDDPRRLF